MSTAHHEDRESATDAVVLEPFAERHLGGALKLSQDVSWPYRIEDWAFALQVGQGFVMERAGEVIGTAAWFPNGESHATAGMIIVSRTEQGRGYGAKLMDALLQAAHPRSIILNSTAEGRRLYERRGFKSVGRIQQHQGLVRLRHDPPPQSIVRLAAVGDREAVLRLDLAATGLQRRSLIERLAEVGEGYVLLRDGEPAGYAISRLFGRGHVIGPVVADTVAGARLLIEAALSRLVGRFVRIDTPSASQLGPWLEDIGLAKVDEALTMVLGTLPPTGPTRLFALSNQSFN